MTIRLLRALSIDGRDYGRMDLVVGLSAAQETALVRGGDAEVVAATDLPPSFALSQNDVTAMKAAVSGYGNSLRSFVPAGNRFGFPRKQSSAAPGFNMMSVRWHRSPPVDVDGLIALWYAGYQHQTSGLTAIGNDLTVAAAVMYPTASAPGAAKAFKRLGSATITVGDGQWVQSDPLSVFLPANTPFRLRSYVAPGASGYVPYGLPGLGAANGSSLSGFGTANDQSAYANAQADSTQASTGIATNATSDTMYEPIIIARPASWVQSWALFGDSRTYGANEVGVSGGTTSAGAGDAWGNVGMWERACGINGHLGLNLGISGSVLNTWATDGYSDFLMHVATQSCNACVIALGTNDALTYTADQMLTNLQKMVNKARALGFSRILVPTLAPRTTSTDSFATTANQTIDATRSPRITTLNGYLRAGQLTGATVVDQGAMVQDPTDPQKWRCDLGFASTSDGTHETPQAIVYCAALLAPLMA